MSSPNLRLDCRCRGGCLLRFHGATVLQRNVEASDSTDQEKGYSGINLPIKTQFKFWNFAMIDSEKWRVVLQSVCTWGTSSTGFLLTLQ